MILNKASFERGFAHATVYKSEVSGWCVKFLPKVIAFFFLPLCV